MSARQMLDLINGIPIFNQSPLDNGKKKTHSCRERRRVVEERVKAKTGKALRTIQHADD